MAMLSKLESLLPEVAEPAAGVDPARRRLLRKITADASSSAPAQHDKNQNPFQRMANVNINTTYHTTLRQPSTNKKIRRRVFLAEACKSFLLFYVLRETMSRSDFLFLVGNLRLARLWQRWAAHSTVDLDIENCCFVLLLQIMDRLQPSHPCWPSVRNVLQQCAQNRKTITQEHLHMSLPEGKAVLLEVFNGAAIASHLTANEVLQSLSKAAAFCRWTAANVWQEVYATCVKDRERDRPDASCLFFLWSAVEDLVLEAWLDVVVKSNPAHISLRFDGVRISENAISGDVSDFCKECELHIQRKTGYQVRIRPKYHSDMLGGVHTHAFERESLQDDVKELKQHGNCIPLAFHCIGYVAEIADFLANKQHEHNVYFLRRGHRTYKQLQEVTGASLQPVLMPVDISSMEFAGKYILRCSRKGLPHAVAMRAMDANNSCVYDSGTAFCISRDDFLKVLASACDRRHL